jgi:hypothetical protein
MPKDRTKTIFGKGLKINTKTKEPTEHIDANGGNLYINKYGQFVNPKTYEGEVVRYRKRVWDTIKECQTTDECKRLSAYYKNQSYYENRKKEIVKESQKGKNHFEIKKKLNCKKYPIEIPEILQIVDDVKTKGAETVIDFCNNMIKEHRTALVMITDWYKWLKIIEDGEKYTSEVVTSIKGESNNKFGEEK